ncbi:MAG: hypothetical protein NXI25_06230 [bacterium]|nr:hypothetical protein [bacterium]
MADKEQAARFRQGDPVKLAQLQSNRQIKVKIYLEKLKINQLKGLTE